MRKVSIPYPKTIPRGEGIHSTFEVTPIAMRISRFEAEEVEKACEKLGLTASSFARWCTVKVAEEVNKDRRKK